MKVALLQLTSGDDPAQNVATVVMRVADAVAQGAEFICTPEVTNCVSMDRAHQAAVLQTEADDPMLARLRQAAKDHAVWLSIGSLALKGGADGRFVNRSFLIAPDGVIVARYDKIHMFDVTVSETEIYRESAGYAPGEHAVLARAGEAVLGLSICYDLRFPQLYRKLAQAGANVLLVPSAFSPVTGAAHWHTLLRARAIETGCFVIAAAQTGSHPAQAGRPRQTFGHSLVVSPWGDVLSDAGVGESISIVDIDLAQVSDARRRMPSLSHDRVFTDPLTDE